MHLHYLHVTREGLRRRNNVLSIRRWSDGEKGKSLNRRSFRPWCWSVKTNQPYLRDATTRLKCYIPWHAATAKMLYVVPFLSRFSTTQTDHAELPLQAFSIQLSTRSKMIVVGWLCIWHDMCRPSIAIHHGQLMGSSPLNNFFEQPSCCGSFTGFLICEWSRPPAVVERLHWRCWEKYRAGLIMNPG